MPGRPEKAAIIRFFDAIIYEEPAPGIDLDKA